MEANLQSEETQEYSTEEILYFEWFIYAFKSQTALIDAASKSFA